MFKNKLTKILSIGLFSTLLFSCQDKHNNTGTEFAPNMYHSVGYEPMSQTEGELNTINPNGMNMRYPVNGTIPRTKRVANLSDSLNTALKDQTMLAKTIPNDSISYSEKLLKNPFAATESNIEAGKLQYERYCQHCHGEAGKGDGLVAKQYKGVPVYSSDALKTLNDGHIYHTITHGKGRMWAHGSQISPENRWKIVLYVHELQKN